MNMNFRLNFFTFYMMLPLCFVYHLAEVATSAVANTTTVSAATGFKRAVVSPSFVDKTLFIKHFIDKGESVVLSAPRGFGKSTNLDMLRLYLEIPDPLDDRNDTSWLFHDKLIARSPLPDHLMGHLVIFLDFGRLNTSSAVEFEASLWEILLDEVDRFKRYQEFYKPVPKFDGGKKNYSRTLEGRFSKLIWNLQKLYQKSVYLLVEHFDFPIAYALSKPEVDDKEIRKMVELIGRFKWQTNRFNTEQGPLLINAHGCRFVGATYNVHSQFSVQTLFLATIRVDGIYGLSATHPQLKFKRAMYDPQLTEFFGFTEKEALNLAKKFNRNLDEMRFWYGGRQARGTAGTIYCPYSTGRFIRLGEPKSYWGTHYLDWKNESFPSEAVMLGELGRQLDDSIYTKIKIEWRNITLDDVLRLRTHLMDAFGKSDHNFDPKLSQIALQLLTEYGVYTTSPANEISAPNHEVAQEVKRLVYSTAYLREKFHTEPEDVSAYLKSLSRATRNKTTLFEDSLSCIHRLLSHSTVKSERDMLVVLYYATLSRADSDYAKFLRQYSEVPIFEPGKNKHALLDMLLFSWDSTGVILELRYEEGSAFDALREILQRKLFKVFELPRFQKLIIKRKVYIGVYYSSKSNLTTLSYLCGSERIEDAVNVTLPDKFALR